MYKIYKHTNKINNKSYIGQTCKIEAKYRWGKNGSDYDRQPKFWRAIQKYGWDNFTHEVLKNNIETAEEATYWEAYYIIKYDSIANGYNIRDAGVNGAMTSLYKPVYQYDLDGNFIKKFDSLTKAWEETGVAFSSISKACSSKLKSAGNYQWRWDYLDKIQPINRLTNAKKLYQFSLDGKLIAVYSSGIEAENKTGILRSDISSCASKNKRTAGGYVWRYQDDEFSLPEKQTTAISIDQFSAQDTFIKTWPSMASIYQNLGIRQGNIYACCNGLRQYAGGYKWKYHIEESINMENKTQLTAQIERIDDFMTRIYELRKQGLQSADGEFSLQNLVFKEIRNRGYLDKLRDLKAELVSKDLSLEEA